MDENGEILLVHASKNLARHSFYLGMDDFAIDTVSNLVFWSRLANKLEPWYDVYMFTLFNKTKHSNLNLIDRLQFPWLKVSIIGHGLTIKQEQICRLSNFLSTGASSACPRSR